MTSASPTPSVAVILGSAFDTDFLDHFENDPIHIESPFGRAQIHRFKGARRPAYALFRHGLPHRLLPNQINYLANAWALRHLSCGALLVNSSVGVLDPAIPLNRPMLVSDLYMPDNRLPDGSTCTVFTEPTCDHGHLLVNEGLLSPRLSQAIHTLDPEQIRPVEAGLVFAYAGGPRSKTPAENAALAKLGAQVNSMTFGPEIVLANELGIPCAGLVVGHKYSVPGIDSPDHAGITASLEQARAATDQALLRFLKEIDPLPFGNKLHRFE